MENLEKKLKEAASQFETEENMKAYISKMTNESLNTMQKQHDEEMKQLKDSLSQSNEAQLKHLERIIKLHEPTERSDVAEIVKQLEDMKNMVQNTNYSDQSSDSIEKNQDELLKELEVRQGMIKKLEVLKFMKLQKSMIFAFSNYIFIIFIVFIDGKFGCQINIRICCFLTKSGMFCVCCFCLIIPYYWNIYLYYFCILAEGEIKRI